MIISVPPKPILKDLLCNGHGVELPVFNRSYEDTVKRYREDHRFYHTLSHAVEVFSYCWSHRRRSTDELALLLAAWWHDVIYDPTSPTNEKASADYAEEQIELFGFDTTGLLRHQVRELILVTKEHQPAYNYPLDSMILIDADLAPFSLPLETMLRRGRLIRKEYSHVSDADFYPGRVKVLEHFLKRDPFYYHTDLDPTLAKTNINVEMMAAYEFFG